MWVCGKKCSLFAILWQEKVISNLNSTVALIYIALYESSQIELLMKDLDAHTFT